MAARFVEEEPFINFLFSVYGKVENKENLPATERIIVICDETGNGDEFISVIKSQGIPRDTILSGTVEGLTDVDCTISQPQVEAMEVQMVRLLWEMTGVFFCNLSKPIKNPFPVKTMAHEFCQRSNRFCFTKIVAAAKTVANKEDQEKEVSVPEPLPEIKKITQKERRLYRKIKSKVIFGITATSERFTEVILAETRNVYAYVDDYYHTKNFNCSINFD